MFDALAILLLLGMMAASPFLERIHNRFARLGLTLLALLILAYLPMESRIWGFTLTAVGALGMMVGSFRALLSGELEGTMEFSSLSHTGFILLGIGLDNLMMHAGGIASNSVVLYMINYAVVETVIFLTVDATVTGDCHVSLANIRGYGRRQKRLMIPFALAGASLAGLPGLLGYVSKTLLHEGIVHMAEHAPVWSVVLEVLFFLAGGCTAAYMVKLFVTLFIRRETTEEPGCIKAAPRKLVEVVYFPILLLTVLGVFPVLAERIGGFLTGSDISGTVPYFSFHCLRSVLILIPLGVALSFVARGFLLLQKKWREKKQT